jgi:Mrp family chromosome partitioning ATPase
MAASSVQPNPNADILTFSVDDSDPARARDLATGYAAAFIAFRRTLDTAALTKARNDIGGKLKQLAKAGDGNTALYRSLLDKQQQLVTMQTLETANAVLIRPATGATKVRPQPRRTAVIGLVIGIGLGLLLALLADAIESPLHSATEVETRLGLPVLGRLPQLSRRIRKRSPVPTLSAPASAEAEAFRILGANFEFVNAEADAHVIMAVSAQAGEGKTTTIVNLAVTLARDGAHVILAEFDMRRPTLSALFQLPPHRGVEDVIAGRSDISSSLVPVPIGRDGRSREPGNRNGAATPGRGTLELLTARGQPEAATLVRTAKLAEMLEELRARADIVLVDVPPLLQVGDALRLSSHVDAVIVVARPSALRRRTLSELHRVLGTLPAPRLGVVITGDDSVIDGPYHYLDYSPDRNDDGVLRRFRRLGRSRVGVKGDR